MRHNTVKEKLRRGEPSFGIWLDGPSPARIEFYGQIGYEFVIIDTEHTAIDLESMLEMVRACEVVGVIPIVRPANHEASTILSYLDMGVMGLFFNHVQSAENVRAIVDRVKYAPIGSRSAVVPRAARGGPAQSPKDYMQQANEETMITLLVEDVIGLSNLDEILKVEGVDVVCIGPSDLSNSMGFVGERDHPEVRKVILEAEARIAAVGMPFDCEPEDAADAREAIARGARLIPFFEGNMLKTLFSGVLKELTTPGTRH